MSAVDGWHDDALLIYMPTCPCRSCVAYRASNGPSRDTDLLVVGDCPSCHHLTHAGDCDECLCNYEPTEVTP